ncbi:hypothetical protein HDV01_003074 [Terramyces sp. JEL0728]|nr:hypothetical protein HDV01_003074 [Terramyces sp. JEL0728]
MNFLLFGLSLATKLTQLNGDSSDGVNTGVFNYGSVLTGEFNPNVTFTLKPTGLIQFEFDNDKVIHFGAKIVAPAASSDGSSSPNLYLDSNGILYAQTSTSNVLAGAGGDMSTPLYKSNAFTGPLNVPYVMAIEYDFKLRVRNGNNDVVWEYPQARPFGQITKLDSQSSNWLSEGECITSTKQVYSICLNGGQIIANTGYSFNARSPIDEPRVFIMHDDASFGLYDYTGANLQLPIPSGFAVSLPKTQDYFSTISDAGVFGIASGLATVASVDVTSSSLHNFIYAVNLPASTCLAIVSSTLTTSTCTIASKWFYANGELEYENTNNCLNGNSVASCSSPSTVTFDSGNTGLISIDSTFKTCLSVGGSVATTITTAPCSQTDLSQIFSFSASDVTPALTYQLLHNGNQTVGNGTFAFDQQGRLRIQSTPHLCLAPDLTNQLTLIPKNCRIADTWSYSASSQWIQWGQDSTYCVTNVSGALLLKKCSNTPAEAFTFGASLIADNQVCSSSGPKCASAGSTCCLSDDQSKTICRPSSGCPAPWIPDNQVCSSGGPKCASSGSTCCLSDDQSKTICRPSSTCPTPLVPDNQVCSSSGPKCASAGSTCCLSDDQSKTICRPSSGCPAPWIPDNQACTPGGTKCASSGSTCCLTDDGTKNICRATNACPATPSSALSYTGIYQYNTGACITVNNGAVVMGSCGGNNLWANDNGLIRYKGNPYKCITTSGNSVALTNCVSASKFSQDINHAAIMSNGNCLASSNGLVFVSCNKGDVNQAFGMNSNMVAAGKSLGYFPFRLINSANNIMCVNGWGDDVSTVFQSTCTQKYAWDGGYLRFVLNPAMCLHAVSAQNYGRVILQSCETATQWSRNGLLLQLSGTSYCVDAGGANGLWPCDSHNGNQLMDTAYYVAPGDSLYSDNAQNTLYDGMYLSNGGNKLQFSGGTINVNGLGCGGNGCPSCSAAQPLRLTLTQCGLTIYDSNSNVCWGYSSQCVGGRVDNFDGSKFYYDYQNPSASYNNWHFPA